MHSSKPNVAVPQQPTQQTPHKLSQSPLQQPPRHPSKPSPAKLQHSPQQPLQQSSRLTPQQPSQPLQSKPQPQLSQPHSNIRGSMVLDVEVASDKVASDKVASDKVGKKSEVANAALLTSTETASAQISPTLMDQAKSRISTNLLDQAKARISTNLLDQAKARISSSLPNEDQGAGSKPNRTAIKPSPPNSNPGLDAKREPHQVKQVENAHTPKPPLPYAYAPAGVASLTSPINVAHTQPLPQCQAAPPGQVARPGFPLAIHNPTAPQLHAPTVGAATMAPYGMPMSHFPNQAFTAAQWSGPGFASTPMNNHAQYPCPPVIVPPVSVRLTSKHALTVSEDVEQVLEKYLLSGPSKVKTPDQTTEEAPDCPASPSSNPFHQAMSHAEDEELLVHMAPLQQLAEGRALPPSLTLYQTHHA